MYFSVQNYPTTNPSPYDDTGWTFPMMRNIIVREVTDAGLYRAAMTKVGARVTAAGGITGTVSTIIVAHTGDNNLMRLRFKLADVPMRAAQDSFTAGGVRFARGAFIMRNANRARIEPLLRELRTVGRGHHVRPRSRRMSSMCHASATSTVDEHAG
jgi:hypothetical protein